MKLCNTCKEPNKEFTVDTRNKDGLQGRCNDCKNIKRRLVYSENPSHFREKQKKYNAYALIKAKKHIQELSDTYVIA